MRFSAYSCEGARSRRGPGRRRARQPGDPELAGLLAPRGRRLGALRRRGRAAGCSDRASGSRSSPRSTRGGAATRRVDGIRYVRRGGHLTVYLWAALFLLTARGSAGSTTGARGAERHAVPGPPVHPRHGSPCSCTTCTGSSGRSSVRCWPGSAGSWSRGRRAGQPRTPAYLAVSEVTRSELVDLGVRAAGHHDRLERHAAGARHTCRAEAASPAPGDGVRLVPHKRVEHAMEAVAALRERHPGLHLTVMGSGWWEPELLRAPRAARPRRRGDVPRPRLRPHEVRGAVERLGAPAALGQGGLGTLDRRGRPCGVPSVA